MASAKLTYTIGIILVALLVPSYVSSQNSETSPEFPPSPPVEGGRTLAPVDSTESEEPEEPIPPQTPWFRPHFRHHRPRRPFPPLYPPEGIFPNFGFPFYKPEPPIFGFRPFNPSIIWNYVYSILHDFTTEACSSPENNGTCNFKFLIDHVDNGNETCAVYTVGNCDEDIQSYRQRGCVHKCRLPCNTTEKPSVGGPSTVEPPSPTLPPAGEPASVEPFPAGEPGSEEPFPEETPSEAGVTEEPTTGADVPIEADENNEP